MIVEVETEEKYYMWVERHDIYGEKPTFSEMMDTMRMYHTEAELLESCLSKSIKKRISSVRIGSYIKIGPSSHSSADVYLVRIEKSILETLDKYSQIQIDISILEGNIDKLKVERYKLIELLPF